MRKATSVTDWRNRSRTVANNELEKKAELFAELERYIRNGHGWLGRVLINRGL
jgi:hypothetical protein